MGLPVSKTKKTKGRKKTTEAYSPLHHIQPEAESTEWIRMVMRMAVIGIRGIIAVMSVGRKIALFPCVGCLGDGTGGNHVQQVFSLTLHRRGGLVGRQARVHVGHGHTCQENTSEVSRLQIYMLHTHLFVWKKIEMK